MSPRAARPSPTLKPRDRKAWRAWLRQHHREHHGLFLLVAKKHLLERSPGRLTLDEAVEEALCFGWIDGLVKYWDEDWRAIRFTPRRDDSIWSEPNKKRVARLIRERRMTRAGLRLVEVAKENGQWRAARERERLVPPRALKAALDENATAAAFWQALSPSHRKQWIYWVTEAKRPQTAARRIAAVVRECAAGRKPGLVAPAMD